MHRDAPVNRYTPSDGTERYSRFWAFWVKATVKKRMIDDDEALENGAEAVSDSPVRDVETVVDEMMTAAEATERGAQQAS